MNESDRIDDTELERIRQEKLRRLLQERENPPRKTEDLPSVIVLTDFNFKETVRKHPLMLVDFWAPWCGPCRIVSPIVEELAEELKGKVAFGKLNVDENRGTAADFQIFSIPTLVIFKDGVEVDRVIGAVPKKMIKAALERHLY